MSTQSLGLDASDLHQHHSQSIYFSESASYNYLVLITQQLTPKCHWPLSGLNPHHS